MLQPDMEGARLTAERAVQTALSAEHDHSSEQIYDCGSIGGMENLPTEGMQATVCIT